MVHSLDSIMLLSTDKTMKLLGPGWGSKDSHLLECRPRAGTFEHDIR